MKSTISYPSLWLGIVIGAWMMFFAMKAIISQEFSGLEAAGNADYVQLRNEILDDWVMIPLMTTIPLTIGVGVIMGVIGWSKKKAK
ncbi:MAG: hypothetical protein AAB473_03785 [Patescibacteria group bacterium]